MSPEPSSRAKSFLYIGGSVPKAASLEGLGKTQICNRTAQALYNIIKIQVGARGKMDEEKQLIQILPATACLCTGYTSTPVKLEHNCKAQPR